MSTAEQGSVDIPRKTYDFHQGYNALDEEHSGWLTNISGAIPSDLKGTFFRNGPGTMKAGEQQYGHWFDGPGMISAVTFVEGRVHFKNRYIRTERYIKDTAAGKICSRGFGTQLEGGLRENFLRPMENPGNTNISWHGDKLCAFYEGGQPWRLNPATLETHGKELYDGALTSVKSMSAHGKINPKNGHQINFGVNVNGLGLKGLTFALDVHDINPNGKIARSCCVPLGDFPFLHDFGMTQNYAIFLVSSISMSLEGPILGTKTLAETMTINMGAPMRGVIVDLRSMQLVRQFELPPAIIVHFGNSFEQGDEIITDCVQSADIGNFTGLNDVFTAERLTGGPFYRYRFNVKTGEINSELYRHIPDGEFPTWNMAETGSAARNLYYVATTDNGTPFSFNTLAKLDTSSGALTTHDYGENRYTSEALFAPKAGASGDDEGYMLSFVYDATTHLTEVVIVDAQNLDNQVAAIKLDHHVPFGFHGHFTPEVFISG
ncbi:MAG: all-trans-8'-apo-beta-carotenal 15,15'-oxygenase [Halioglobus sp.]